MSIRLLADPPHNDPKLSSFLQQFLRDTRDAVNLLARKANENTGTVNALDYGLKGDGVTDDSGALSAAVTAAGANGTVLIPGAVTCVINNRVNVTSANVTIQGGGLGTVLQRGSGLTTSDVISLSGSGCVIRNLTIDGNSVSNTAEEIGLFGTHTVVDSVKVINSKRICIAVAADFTTIRNCWLVGTGATTDGFGIWGDNAHLGTYIEGGVITDFSLNGIFLSGTNFRINGTYLARNQIKTSPGGGQIAIPQGSGSNASSGWSISNVTIGARGGIQTYGIELNGDNGTGLSNNGTISGVTITGQGLGGIVANDSTGIIGVTITGCTITDTLNGPAIKMGISNSALQVVGNRLIDDQVSPTQTYGVTIGAGSSSYIIANNDCRGNATGGILDSGAGSVVVNNLP